MRAIAVRSSEILDRRARALRTGDRRLFLSDVYRGDERFVELQERYFHNLRQLPWETLEYDVLADRWNPSFAEERWESSAYIPFVRVRMQLRGFDEVPVVFTTGITFVQREGQWVVVSDTDVADQVRDGAQETPWDLTRIVVKRSENVLAVFDTDSAKRSGQVMDALDDSVQVVSDALPSGWDGRVVVYATADKQVLSAFDYVPGSDVDGLGAVAFPVFAREQSRRVASMRFLVHPRSLELKGPWLRAVLGHELTHVALARRSSGVPIWLAEGVAEYVGMQGMPRAQWRIEASVVKRARRGATELPGVATFNAIDQAWHYSLSWFACDYIAATYGDEKVWELLRTMHNGGRGTSEERQDRVLRRVLGISGAELARRAADRIADSFVLPES